MKPANISPLHGAFSVLQRKGIHSVISGVMYGTQFPGAKEMVQFVRIHCLCELSVEEFLYIYIT
jgi:hypothetical protein